MDSSRERLNGITEAIAAALYMLPPLAFVIIVLARHMRRGRAK